MDQVGALEGGQLQAQNLGLEEGLEGEFGQEERFPQAVRVSDGGPDVGVSEELEGIHSVDGLDEDL